MLVPLMKCAVVSLVCLAAAVPDSAVERRRRARQVLDAIVRELRADRRFVLNGHQVEILTGQTDGATGAAQVGRQ